MVEHSKVINEQKLGVMARETFGREPYGVQNHTQLHSFELFFWILAKGYENFTSFMNAMLSPLLAFLVTSADNFHAKYSSHSNRL